MYKRPLVSIIIPAYNEEKHIERCLESITYQKYFKLEIIVVNDGSTDSTAEIVSRMKDDRIRLLNQEHQGPAAARQNALVHVTGEWVLFVDADDYIEEDMISSMMSCATEATDMVSCNFIKEYSDHREYIQAFPGMEKFSRKLEENFFSLKYTWGLLLGKLIRTAIITENHCTFDPDLKKCEDIDFMMQVVSNCKRADFNMKYMYHYCINVDFFTKGFSEELKDSYVRACQKFYRRVQNPSAKWGKEDFNNWLLLALSRLIINYSFCPMKDMGYRRKRESASSLVNREMFKKALKSSDMRGFSSSRRMILKLLKYRQYWLIPIAVKMYYRMMQK